MGKTITGITKKHNHDHFWILDGLLFETYNTLRGHRYMQVLEVPGMPDTDKCTEACIEYINQEYLT